MMNASELGTGRRRAIGTFPQQQAAEQALEALQHLGFPMEQMAVIVRDPAQIRGTAEAPHYGNKADEGAIAGAVTGGVLGTVTGLFVGLGTLAIPGVGPILLAGTVATALVTTLAGTIIGLVAGSLLGALIGLGVPEADARVYRDRIQRGNALLIVDGTSGDIARAEPILYHYGIEAYRVYEVPVAAGVSPTRSLEEPFYRRRHPHRSPSPSPSDPGPAFSQRHAMASSRGAIATMATLSATDAAIAYLEQAGFPVQQMALIARSPVPQQHPRVALRDRLDPLQDGTPVPLAQLYQTYLKRGGSLISLRGTGKELQHALTLLASHGLTSWNVYEIPRSAAANAAPPPPRSQENALASDHLNHDERLRRSSEKPIPPPPPPQMPDPNRLREKGSDRPTAHLPAPLGTNEMADLEGRDLSRETLHPPAKPRTTVANTHPEVTIVDHRHDPR